jgi:hypothetical protein
MKWRYQFGDGYIPDTIFKKFTESDLSNFLFTHYWKIRQVRYFPNVIGKFEKANIFQKFYLALRP